MYANSNNAILTSQSHTCSSAILVSMKICQAHTSIHNIQATQVSMEQYLPICLSHFYLYYCGPPRDSLGFPWGDFCGVTICSANVPLKEREIVSKHHPLLALATSLWSFRHHRYWRDPSGLPPADCYSI